MDEVDVALSRLDPATAEQAGPAVRRLLGAEEERLPLSSLTQLDLQQLLWDTLPSHWSLDAAEQHEAVWALGDFFEAAGLLRYAAICRDRRTHEILAAWRADPDAGRRRGQEAQISSGVLPADTALLAFGEVQGPVEGRVHRLVSALLEDGIATGALDPGRRGFRGAAVRRTDRFLEAPAAELAGESPLRAVWKERADDWQASFRGPARDVWERALPAVHTLGPVPPKVHHAVAPATALLAAVGEGVTLTGAGYLPPAIALGLDERFGWSQDFALGRPRGEADVPPLWFVDEHLREQRLLTRRGRQLTVSAAGRRLAEDPAALWSALVAPRPRWRAELEQDVLGVLAACVLGQERPTVDSVRAEAVAVLATKWHPVGGGREGDLEETVAYLEIDWYRVGLVLGWWEERGTALGLRPTAAGRAACASVFRTAATRPRSR